MPTAPRRACLVPTCGSAAVVHGRCRQHEAHYHRPPDRRPAARIRGYGGAWQKARRGYLTRHPLCAICEQSGVVVGATVVDHITPHRGDRTLFWDSANWQALCATCHNRKTGSGR